jgi:uncharacterized membrane protein YdbT with pleckstrin-like domain
MIRAASRNKREFGTTGREGLTMSYAEKSLVPGETLLYQTRHHWMVLLGPLLISVVLAGLGVGCLAELVAAKEGRGMLVGVSETGVHATQIAGVLLIVVAIAILAFGLAKRNATEMAVTNKRVLIKTGMGNRRTLDLMLSRVESIAVEETFWGRMMGYGSVVVRGTGGTPESFVMISHPQEFRRSVQGQIGQEPIGAHPPA